MEAHSDDLENKLARLADRVADRGEATRAELERIGFLEAAELLRTTFSGRLTHLRTDRLEIGRPLEPGQTYNFDLKGHANGAVVQDRPSSAPRKAHKKRSHKPGPIPTSLRDRAAGTD